MEGIWGDKRYNSLNSFLKRKFGRKVYKIALDGGFSCPNRDGTLSKEGCIFCSARGSGDFAGEACLSIEEQFSQVKDMMRKKWKEGGLIAYFQAYTNTYGKIEVLREKYEEALSQEGVIGLAIATRPDCLSEAVLDLLQELSQRTYLWVELGLQTIKPQTAFLINRGYKLNVFEEALIKLKERNIEVVVHTIFGLPGETKEDMLDTVSYLSHKNIDGIKFHLLHLMRGTPLEKYYEATKFSFLTLEEYVNIVVEAITILPKDVVIHRLTGDSPRDLLIGPMWSLKKWEVLNSIDNTLKKEDKFQGLYYSTNKHN